MATPVPGHCIHLTAPRPPQLVTHPSRPVTRVKGFQTIRTSLKALVQVPYFHEAQAWLLQGSC